MISPQPLLLDGALREFFASDPVLLSGASAEKSAPAPLAAFQQIVEITSDVFGQQPTISHDFNPEFPEEKLLVLHVELPPDRALMLEKEATWTKKVAAVKPPLDMVRLSIKPKR